MAIQGVLIQYGRCPYKKKRKDRDTEVHATREAETVMPLEAKESREPREAEKQRERILPRV